MPTLALRRRPVNRQRAEQIAGDAHGERRSDVFEILAFLRRTAARSTRRCRRRRRTRRLRSRAWPSSPNTITPLSRPGAIVRRAERAIGEVEIADAGVLLEAERHLEAAALDATPRRRSSTRGRRPSSRRTRCVLHSSRSPTSISRSISQSKCLRQVALQADAQRCAGRNVSSPMSGSNPRHSSSARPRDVDVDVLAEHDRRAIVPDETALALSCAAAGTAASAIEDRARSTGRFMRFGLPASAWPRRRPSRSTVDTTYSAV